MGTWGRNNRGEANLKCLGWAPSIGEIPVSSESKSTVSQPATVVSVGRLLSLKILESSHLGSKLSQNMSQVLNSSPLQTMASHIRAHPLAGFCFRGIFPPISQTKGQLIQLIQSGIQPI